MLKLIKIVGTCSPIVLHINACICRQVAYPSFKKMPAACFYGQSLSVDYVFKCILMPFFFTGGLFSLRLAGTYISLVSSYRL